MSLQRRIAAGGPLPPADLHGIAVGVATALAAIHTACVVHRDLKPSNVVLILSGCRIIDFGIARAQEATATSAGTVLGPPGWIPPEVLSGEHATPAADVFREGRPAIIARAQQPVPLVHGLNGVQAPTPTIPGASSALTTSDRNISLDFSRLS